MYPHPVVCNSNTFRETIMRNMALYYSDNSAVQDSHQVPHGPCRFYGKHRHCYSDCHDLHKITCFHCQPFDHFRGQCTDFVDDHNPRLEKDAVTLQEAIVKLKAWKIHYSSISERMTAAGLEGDVIAYYQRIPDFGSLPQTFNEAITQASAWKIFCASMFKILHAYGLDKGKLLSRLS